MKRKLKLLKHRNYLAMINNSVGSKQYQNLWGEWENGKIEDITKGGELSCAVYVTSILKLFGLIREQKATVSSTVTRIKKEGWIAISKKEIEPGDVIVWKRNDSGSIHPHIGFYVGNSNAVSNSTELRKIVRHSWNYSGKRKITEVLRWPNW